MQDVLDWLKSLNINTQLYPLAFPATSPVEAMIVEIGGASNRGSVYDTTLTITVRAGHPSEAERLSLDVISKLNLLTNQEVGEYQLILIRTQSLIPQYLGKDAEGNHFYMNNFRVLIS